MNRHLVFKMSCFRVAELRNSPAITRVPRLEPEHFNRQSIRPRLNQRLPSSSPSIAIWMSATNVWDSQATANNSA